MRDNTDSSPEVIELRHRSKSNQTTLNIELGISKQGSSSSGGAGSTSPSVGGSVVGGLIGGEIPPTYCFSGDTLFSFWGGFEIPFATLFQYRQRHIGMFTISWHDGELVRGKILNVMKTIAHEYLEVTFADGSVDNVKSQHRYLTPSGEYVEIQHLLRQLIVCPKAEMMVTGLKLVFSETGIEMFNATIETYQNYCANGKIVHNLKRRDED